MSTCNFRKQKNFDLYVFNDDEFYTKEVENGVWDGCDPCDDGAEFDEFLYSDYCGELQKELDKINDDLSFHRLELESGYYSGTQVVANLTDYASYCIDDDGNADDVYNDDTKYYYNMYKSEFIRKFRSEINRINKYMKKFAKDFGLLHLSLDGIFSNGEAVYSIIN